ncbi:MULTISPECIES: hemerythrin domain-containing protein [unclassified Amycolatopsis]|uniref:hemerythrin domain-containing protein n=1 Tax=unclassified Amycolatopsis TaxID=2618356 RepID=UPI002875715E|nr:MULTISPECIES: hemerythrin domain-containing protein [unclassified Amycolatopsis]MDS0134897.1 hemerythrin domain-containing protein [Amycolatopsis sp. 505]MDS0147927.1 hemerythrin domain-containing protein [Amycolatopsis sp. CM201R]
MNGNQPATDLTTVLAGDHRELDRLCTELELGQGSPENRKDLADHLIAELVRHSVAEEPYLDGDGDLAEADGLMRQLEGTGPQETRFERLLGGLIRAVRRHVREEGPAAVREIRRTCSPEQQAELGRQVLETREAAATLPHPGLADRVPQADQLWPGPGFVDRARAALRTPASG